MEASVQSKSFDEGCKIKHKGAAVSIEEIKDWKTIQICPFKDQYN